MLSRTAKTVMKATLLKLNPPPLFRDPERVSNSVKIKDGNNNYPLVRIADYFLKNPRVRKIRVRNSGAGNGCADFMDTWKNAFFLQENLHVHKIPRFGGGEFWFWGGGSADYIFMGAGIFLIIRIMKTVMGTPKSSWGCAKGAEKLRRAEKRLVHCQHENRQSNISLLLKLRLSDVLRAISGATSTKHVTLTKSKS